MSLSLPEAMAATPAMRAIFGASGGIAAMLRVEAALAWANARLGLIDKAAASAIATGCDGEGPDPETLAEEGARAGTVVIPLVAWLRGRVPAHRDAVHRGGTTQDIVDTALVLQLRDGLALLDADLARAAEAAANLARHHATTPMLARTLLQPALPTIFGLKAAQWLAALDEARLSLRDAARKALVLQFGGAAGTLDAFGDAAPSAAAELGAALDLPVPALPWHTRRAPLALLGSAIAAAIGTAGKIATDTALMMQPEVAEAREAAAPGRGGSSAMPHKRNPTLAIAIRAAALRAPGLVSALFAAMPQEHERAAGGFQAEQSLWPALMLAASGACATLADLLSGLEIDAEAMRRNLVLAPDAVPSAAIARMIAAALASHRHIVEDLDG